MFIVIEGPDASGKQTQTKRLVERFTAAGREVVLFSFPRYETPLGKAILRHLKSEIMVSEEINDFKAQGRAPEDAMIFQCMMVTDKYDAAPDIADAVHRGAVVVADRWWPSAYAYGAADGLPARWFYRAHSHLPHPDLSILLDVRASETLRRRPEARDRYEKDRAKQVAVREHYLALWNNNIAHETYGHARWTIVDGAGTVDEVAAAIWERVEFVGGIR